MLPFEQIHWLFLSLTILFISLVGVELWLRLRLYRFAPQPSQPLSNSPLSVSVLLLCEPMSSLEDTMRTLEAIASQQAVNVEVHVLTDALNTTLQNEVERYASQAAFPIRYTLLPQTMKNIAHRKMAITLGTKSARHEAIVLTQAGIVPSTPYWLHTMATHALAQEAYAAPVLLADKHSGNNALRYLFTLLGLATQRPISAHRVATEANFAYTKTMFGQHSKVFSKDLDGEGGEAINILRTLDDKPLPACTIDAIAYLQQAPTLSPTMLQAFLRMADQKYPELLRTYKLGSRILGFTWLALLLYIALRLALPSFAERPEALLCDALISLALLAQILTHSASFARLTRSLRVALPSLLAYWHALWLPLYIYYYKRLYATPQRS